MFSCFFFKVFIDNDEKFMSRAFRIKMEDMALKIISYDDAIKEDYRVDENNSNFA